MYSTTDQELQDLLKKWSEEPQEYIFKPSPLHQQGWACPKCGAVMSPYTTVCVNCRGMFPNVPIQPQYPQQWPITICCSKQTNG